MRINVNESREAITQSLATTQLLLDSRRNVEEVKGQSGAPAVLNCFDASQRKLKIGQWVDVKDTINQWCEAQVVNVNEDKALIHYNGWGTRWDEWIEMASPRIAVFRTYTIQSATAKYLSPFPNMVADSRPQVSIAESSLTSLDSFSKITELSTKTLVLMKELKTLRTVYDKRIQIQKKTEEDKRKHRQRKREIKYRNDQMEKYKELKLMKKFEAEQSENRKVEEK